MSKYNSIERQLRCGVQVNLYPLEFVPRACLSFRFAEQHGITQQ